MDKITRRKFIGAATLAGAGIAVQSWGNKAFASQVQVGRRVGLIGLDNSRADAFTKTLLGAKSETEYGGYKVVAAYPYGSKTIKSAADRIPQYTEDVKKLGVEITGSVAELLQKVDVVILLTNDGHLHAGQAQQVLKAGKRLFIDKPMAASLSDVRRIFKMSEEYNTPVFSSSSIRYMDGVDDILNGKIGKVIGAQTYSPAILEPTHPDFFWYGVHSVELLYTLMGAGCKSVVRVTTPDTDVIVGTWADGRIGTARGTRSGKKAYGATVFGEKNTVSLDNPGGNDALLKHIVSFFETGQSPVKAGDSMEIYAFMEAADRSKNANGTPVALEII